MGVAPAEDAEPQAQAPGPQRRLRHKGETWTFSEWKPKGRKTHRIRAIHAESVERLERAASDSQLFFESANGRNLFSSPLGGDSTVTSAKKSWQPRDSAKLYNVAGWGSPYFHVDRAGHVCVSPSGGETFSDVSPAICWILQHPPWVSQRTHLDPQQRSECQSARVQNQMTVKSAYPN